MPKSKLHPKEVSMIKGIFKHYPSTENQEILSWFSVPGRLINSGRISEIKNDYPHYAGVSPCTKARVDEFMSGKLPLAQLHDQFVLPGMGAQEGLARKEKVFGDLDVEVGASVLRVMTQESSFVEFKQNYEAKKVPSYLKTLSAMLNAGRLGRIFFGVEDESGEIVGVSASTIRNISADRFHRTLNSYFDPFYEVAVEVARVGSRRLVCVRTVASPLLPVICRKNQTVNEDGDNRILLEEGAVYYRYGSSTEKIRYAEMRSLLNKEADDEVRRRLGNLGHAPDGMQK